MTETILVHHLSNHRPSLCGRSFAELIKAYPSVKHQFVEMEQISLKMTICSEKRLKIRGAANIAVGSSQTKKITKNTHKS